MVKRQKKREELIIAKIIRTMLKSDKNERRGFDQIFTLMQKNINITQ
jgi:hypothetical protein